MTAKGGSKRISLDPWEQEVVARGIVSEMIRVVEWVSSGNGLSIAQAETLVDEWRRLLRLHERIGVPFSGDLPPAFQDSINRLSENAQQCIAQTIAHESREGLSRSGKGK